MIPSRRTATIDTLLLALLGGILIAPLFRLGYLDNWGSIESTFIGDVRMIREHFPHFGWQPLWYCGTRSDYIYPPALRYGSALIAWLGRVPAVRAYHLYIAILYVAGILSVYWLVRVGSRSRFTGLIASAATALVSPVFLLLPTVRHDSIHLVPQRLHVLIGYGEGPHISAVAVLPAALAAILAALRARNRVALAAAAALSAFVVAQNFYGAASLVMLYPIAVWAVWLCERTPGLWIRAAAIPVLAWGLSAFWLTPSFVRITSENLRLVALPGDAPSRLIFGIAIALFGLISFRVSNRRPEHAWTVFVCGVAVTLSVWVLGAFAFNLRVTGEPRRLTPELDLALILLAAELLRGAWKNSRVRPVAALLAIAAFVPSADYIRHAWQPFPEARHPQDVFQYRVARWVHDKLPGARVFDTGTIRFWSDVWFDNAQPWGGSDQGISNQSIPAPLYLVGHEAVADRAILWLQALGTDAMIVPGPTSAEPYHDFVRPEQFRGVLPVLTSEFPDTPIYAVPRIHPGILRIVDRAAISQFGELGSTASIFSEARLRKYVSVIEDPAQPAANLTWHGSDEFEIDAAVSGTQSILVQESWDTGWHADENGRALPVRRDSAMGFMLIDVPQGIHHLRLRFLTPAENRAGQVIFLMAGCVIFVLLIRR